MNLSTSESSVDQSMVRVLDFYELNLDQILVGRHWKRNFYH